MLIVCKNLCRHYGLKRLLCCLGSRLDLNSFLNISCNAVFRYEEDRVRCVDIHLNLTGFLTALVSTELGVVGIKDLCLILCDSVGKSELHILT